MLAVEDQRLIEDAIERAVAEREQRIKEGLDAIVARRFEGVNLERVVANVVEGLVRSRIQAKVNEQIDALFAGLDEEAVTRQIHQAIAARMVQVADDFMVGNRYFEPQKDRFSSQDMRVINKEAIIKVVMASLTSDDRAKIAAHIVTGLTEASPHAHVDETPASKVS